MVWYCNSMTLHSFHEADFSITRSVTLPGRAMIIRGQVTKEESQTAVQLMAKENRESFSISLFGIWRSGFGLGFYAYQLPGGHHIRVITGPHFSLAFVGVTMPQDIVVQMLAAFRQQARL